MQSYFKVSHITRHDMDSRQACYSSDDLDDLFAVPVPTREVLIKTDTTLWSMVPPEDRLWVVCFEDVLSSPKQLNLLCDTAEHLLSDTIACMKGPLVDASKVLIDCIALARQLADERGWPIPDYVKERRHRLHIHVTSARNEAWHRAREVRRELNSFSCDSRDAKCREFNQHATIEYIMRACRNLLSSPIEPSWFFTISSAASAVHSWRAASRGMAMHSPCYDPNVTAVGLAATNEIRKWMVNRLIELSSNTL